jgi:hypothetical protein
MPDGKPAGVRCVQLSAADLCQLFGQPSRPRVCVSLRPAPDSCGTSAAEAFAYLDWLERATR